MFTSANSERYAVKNKGLFLLVLLVSMAGCGGNKKAKKVKPGKEVTTNVDIPTADDGIRSFFDDEVGAFQLAEDKEKAAAEQKNENEYAWEDDKNQKFKVVLFEFDKYSIRPDQEEAVNFDFAQIKKSLDLAQANGKQSEVIIEGHACHSAGSSVYNLALSEKRAKVLADRLEEQGINREFIKIVGRGQEVPAIVDGKAVTGDREQQAANRRDEVRVIYS